MPIDRRPLRDYIVAEIFGRLHAGLLPVGTRVDELAIALDLEVSRTPVREALSQLAYEGIFEMRVGKGCRVAALNARDIEESYAVIVALEQHALSSIASCELEGLAVRLDAAACAMEDVVDFPAEAQEADDAWHELLVEAAGNRKLGLVLARVKQSVRRAEYQLMHNRETVLKSVSQHRAIADALARADVAATAGVLDHNWREGLREMLRYFGASGTTDSQLTGVGALESLPQ